MKKIIFTLILCLAMGVLQSQNFILPLWEGDPPNYRESGEMMKSDTTNIVRLSLVQHPDIPVFLPSRRNATGEAAVICPGGGYHILAYDWEGSDIARWFSSRGIAAAVLKYRLPVSKSNIIPHKTPLMDAQRAFRMVRYHAESWNIDPGKIGIMGFSAGGHLASTLSTHFDEGDPGNTDPVEKMSCRPDFSILLYPVISFTEEFSHSGDDEAVPVQNSLAYYRALLKKGIPAEMHAYPNGGHGYSLAIGRGHLATWPDRVLEWIRYIQKNNNAD